MKEIKGLDERLVSLQQRLSIAQQFVQDQADMAQVGANFEATYRIYGLE